MKDTYGILVKILDFAWASSSHISSSCRNISLKRKD